MRRILFTLVLIAVVLVAMTAPIVAQEEANATDDQLEDDSNETVVERDDGVLEMDTHQKLSGTTTMTHWRYEGGVWTLTLQSDVQVMVTVSDSGAVAQELTDGEGAASFSVRGGYETYTVNSGESTITFEARPDDGLSAITLTANNGNRIAGARTDAIETEKSPVPWQTVQILVGATAVFAAGGTYRYVRQSLEEEKEEIEQIV